MRGPKITGTPVFVKSTQGKITHIAMATGDNLRHRSLCNYVGIWTERNLSPLKEAIPCGVCWERASVRGLVNPL